MNPVLLHEPRYADEATYAGRLSNGEGPFVFWEDSIESCPEIVVCGSQDWYNEYPGEDEESYGEYPPTDDVWIMLSSPSYPFAQFSMQGLNPEKALDIGEKLAGILIEKGYRAFLEEASSLGFSDIEPLRYVSDNA